MLLFALLIVLTALTVLAFPIWPYNRDGSYWPGAILLTAALIVLGFLLAE